VLAGGQGTRLRSVTGPAPKPLAVAGGRTLLDLQLSHFARAGIEDVLVLTGYGGDEIAAYCADGRSWGLSVRCVREPEALGTAGALSHARDLLASEFMVTYADTVFDFDVERLLAAHHSGPQIGTLLLHPNDHPHDSDLVEVDAADRITAFHPYPHPDAGVSGIWLPNLVNAGVYALRREILDDWEGLPAKPDFGKHVFPHLLRSGRHLRGYRSPEYVKDAGTPKRLAQVSRDLESGRVARQSLRVPTCAVFLDRDGTVNEERGGIRRPADLELIPGAAPAIARLNASDYRSVIVTNQAIIARGDCTEATLQLIHNRLETLLGSSHAFVDRIYYCPHIPDRGFPGERAELKIHCECRKPGIGMLIQAAADLNLLLPGSWLIGDSSADVETARRAGVASILLSTGHAGRDGKYRSQPDLECFDLADAVTLILDRWPVMLTAVAPLVSRIEPGDLVLLGGQARSGKTQYAAALRHGLQAAGKPAAVIRLDNWLRTAEERPGPSVLDGYDLPAAMQFLTTAAPSGGTFRLPRYERLRRRSVADGLELDVSAGAVLIVEGVPALADPALRGIARHRLGVRRDEQQRSAAICRDYASRGWTAERIEQLLIDRQREEFPLIQASLKSADIILENGLEL
jgi:histidinol-phosphate phosphatase family protein